MTSKTAATHRMIKGAAIMMISSVRMKSDTARTSTAAPFAGCVRAFHRRRGRAMVHGRVCGGRQALAGGDAATLHPMRMRRRGGGAVRLCFVPLPRVQLLVYA